MKKFRLPPRHICVGEGVGRHSVIMVRMSLGKTSVEGNLTIFSKIANAYIPPNFNSINFTHTHKTSKLIIYKFLYYTVIYNNIRLKTT